MTPSNRPANENDERTPLWPGLSRRAEERIRWTVSLSVIAAGIGSMVVFLDAKHWTTFAITVGVSIVGMLIAGLWRLVVHGRA